MFNAEDYKTLSDIVFELDKNGEAVYPGYRPNIVESPNGDEYWDGEKRYAHVAIKYMDAYGYYLDTSYTEKIVENKKIMYSYLQKAHDKSVEVAIALGIPKAFWPDIRYGALRILEYPPGAVTHPHKDFDLFTLMCYRNIPSNFQYVDVCKEIAGKTVVDDPYLVDANKLNSQIHFGEILELVMPCYQATAHEVKADKLNRTQYSIVYFSIPNHDTKLPDGTTVKQWLDERLSRSRKTVEVK